MSDETQDASVTPVAKLAIMKIDQAIAGIMRQMFRPGMDQFGNEKLGETYARNYAQVIGLERAREFIHTAERELLSQKDRNGEEAGNTPAETKSIY